MINCANRRLTIIFLLLLIFVASYAQKIDTSYSLLWYKGKKLNDTILMMPGGNTIIFSPVQGQVSVTFAPKKNLLGHYIEELKKNEQRKTELDQLIIRSPKGALKVGLIYHVNKAMDEVKQKSQDIIESKIIVSDKNSPITSSNYAEGDNLPVWLENYYKEIHSFLARMRTESDFDPPVPPSLDLDYCYPCDTVRQSSYEAEGQNFVKKYLGEEKENLKKAADIMHYFSFRKAKNLPYDSNAARRMEPEMLDAIVSIEERIEQKLLVAWNLYKKDIHKATFIADLLTETIHFTELLGLNVSSKLPGLPEIAQQMTVIAMKALDSAIRERDYKTLLNVKWAVGIFRTAELMGLNTDEFEHSVMEVAQMCQFIVSVDADASMGGEGMLSAAKLTGKNIFTAIPDSNCLLKWTLLAPDSIRMKFDLEKAIMESQDQKATYAGTKVWAAAPANLKLDFCKEERDTAIFAGFFAIQGKEEWEMPILGKSPTQFIPTIFMNCFMDKQRIKENAKLGKAEMEKNIKEMKDQYQKNIVSNQQLMGKDPTKMTPQELQKMNKMMMASQNISNMIQQPAINNFILKEQLKNNQKTVFEKSLNGKELVPENKAILNAIFKVTIEHQE